MTEQELADAITLGAEQRNVEFKSAGTLRDLKGKVVRAILGMANLKDGGYVIVGVKDEKGVLTATGLQPHEKETWTNDNLKGSVADYADPYVNFTSKYVSYNGCDLYVIHVREFDNEPVLCKKDFNDAKNNSVLKQGALYSRPSSKNQTVDMPSVEDMRELLRRAALNIAKQILLEHNALAKHTKISAPDPFDLEAKDLLS